MSLAKINGQNLHQENHAYDTTSYGADEELLTFTTKLTRTNASLS